MFLYCSPGDAKLPFTDAGLDIEKPEISLLTADSVALGKHLNTVFAWIEVPSK